MTLRQEQGQAAEKRACGHLEQNGLRLLDRNFRSRRGEIDLIMQDGDTIVFVEVRFRRKSTFGSAAESVDWRKQQKLIAAAQYYLLKHPQRAQHPARFDVVAMSDGSLEWIKNAFQA